MFLYVKLSVLLKPQGVRKMTYQDVILYSNTLPHSKARFWVEEWITDKDACS